MADTAAHLACRALPEVPVRQRVLSLPFTLRYRLAYDAPLVREVLAVFVQRFRKKEVPGVRLSLVGLSCVQPGFLSEIALYSQLLAGRGSQRLGKEAAGGGVERRAGAGLAVRIRGGVGETLGDEGAAPLESTGIAAQLSRLPRASAITKAASRLGGDHRDDRIPELRVAQLSPVRLARSTGSS